MPGQPASRIARIARNQHNKCWRCGKPFTKTPDTHHLNGDHDDDRPENIVAMCHGCHTKLHAPHRFVTREGRMNAIRPPHTEKTKRKIGAARRGQLHTEASKQKMSASRMGIFKGWKWRVDPTTGKRVWIPPTISS